MFAYDGRMLALFFFHVYGWEKFSDKMVFTIKVM